jgi:NAD+ synthase (glutamine-hydrolysing)
VKIALAQLNPTVGDLAGNLKLMVAALKRASEAGAGLAVFPELYLTGYPPRDLLEKKSFLKAVKAQVAAAVRLTRKTPGTGILFGAPVEEKGRLRNSAVLAAGGKLLSAHHKSLLPTYDVFDEPRYFAPAEKSRTAKYLGETLGITVCEDAWNRPELWDGRRYSRDPVAELARAGATLLINISSSPFHIGKQDARYRLIRDHASRHRLPFVYVNQVGANDELVFDGSSMAFDSRGRPTALLPAFEEAVEVVDTSAEGGSRRYGKPEPISEVRSALVLGIRDYMRKCGFSKAVLGLSGGVDSAVTCCLAAEAAGAPNVLGVNMPGPYSSPGSVEDSERLARNLGIGYMSIPVTEIYEAYISSLKQPFEGLPRDEAEENIQARIRGNVLMAISNKRGHLLLSTGNKSEMAVGYCTLYGDMSGGLAAISDVPKTMIYRLAEHINQGGEVIPRASIEKAPSAELRPGQKDQDTLPPYEVLDRILYYYIDAGLGRADIVRKGYDKITVDWVVAAINGSEYKRRQAPPGIKVTTKAFGTGRRMPIAARISQ